jgi:hypothetical protein
MTGYLQKTTSAAPLAVFRIAFGLLLFASMIRFWAKGWIADLYIEPKYFFPFYGFEFIRPVGPQTYLLFAACALCAVLVAIGLFYRIAVTGLFLTFSYIELMDKSTYLNHYYFVSMICLLMIFLPAHVYFSVDAYRNKSLLAGRIPRWSLDSLKVFVCLVYFFAGLAKVNSDWLLLAQPLRTWLPAKNDLPLIGPLFNHVWTAYAFSWLGCLYDLSIPVLLLVARTRPFAYAAVVIFHLLTAVLFPIGMFPYIMMATGLIFFSGDLHGKILSFFAKRTKASEGFMSPANAYRPARFFKKAIPFGLAAFLFIQVALPLRNLLYPGELFWTEEGYRFSWRVMLMEKAGQAEFRVKGKDGTQVVVDNGQFLTTLQQKMMSTQPDMMVQYAHILHDYYAAHGVKSPEVYVESYVVLNGRLGRPLVDPLTDLSKEKDSFEHKGWILPCEYEIKGI